jgi:DNA-binding NarL/FixJ family response regulator
MSEAVLQFSDSPVERATTHRTRVVIIDDHPIVRRGLAELVASMSDMEMVGEAESYARALEVLQTTPTDVAIVDLSLDDSSGLDLLSEIRSRFPSVKSIVFSIHDAELYAPRALRAGAAGFVSKTQPCEDLLTAIRTLSDGEIYVAPDVAQRILRRMSSGGRARADGGVELLSDRELQVFELVGRGQTTGEIARALHLSPKTVETHRQRIKAKLGIDSGTKLLIRAAQWVAQDA